MVLVSFCSGFVATYANFISSAEIQMHWGHTYLLLSMVPLVLGLARYLEIVTDVKLYKTQDSTETIVNDKLLIVIGIVFVGILYVSKIFV